MKITTALLDVRDLYVETAPFIYYTESRSGYVDRMRAIFQEVMDKSSIIFTSTIILSECLAKPLRENDLPTVQAYNDLFEQTSHIRLISVDRQIARRSAILRAQYQLKTPDALHLATAIETGCQAFLTNDLALKRVTDIQVLVLDDLTV